MRCQAAAVGIGGRNHAVPGVRSGRALAATRTDSVQRGAHEVQVVQVWECAGSPQRVSVKRVSVKRVWPLPMNGGSCDTRGRRLCKKTRRRAPPGVPHPISHVGKCGLWCCRCCWPEHRGIVSWRTVRVDCRGRCLIPSAGSSFHIDARFLPDAHYHHRTGAAKCDTAEKAGETEALGGSPTGSCKSPLKWIRRPVSV